jgi:PAS domain-containing protein
MAHYMSKTKKELVDLILDFEQQIKDASDKRQHLAKALESYKNLASGLQQENENFSEQVKRLEKENQLLTRKLRDIEAKKTEITKSLEDEKASYSVFENLFISFAEMNDKKIFLLDHNSLILYASPAVLNLLKVTSKDKLIGHSFLEFFNPRDSIRVRKKINEVCLKDDKKKIKDINFVTNGMLQMKLKLYPVQYMDQPAVKVVVKD